ncbi:DDE-type integrase/transposase/recombinase [Sneathiella chungangensis]|uniref:DDE-type integrase/transposase/recombinase n=1 Tax=Sneathiella chungangensis TaxID=1418234 RepID=A0A845MBS4_9PROT|nr:DDE-type integrase/transposase/recombinase [Sneathiella chungangensis]
MMMYLRFPLTLRNVEDLLHERGVRKVLLEAYGHQFPSIFRGRWLNNRCENSHLPFRRREQAMLKFRRGRSLQKFVSIHSSFHNHFNHERHLTKRKIYKLQRNTALAEWRQLSAA